MKESLQLIIADGMTWNEIIEKAPNYRIDSIISALAMKSGQEIHKNGWSNVKVVDRLLYCIDEIARHCYMDGIAGYINNCDKVVMESASWALKIIGANGKLLILESALKVKHKAKINKLSNDWLENSEDLYEMTWDYLIKSGNIYI